jgi:hypothetical protein
VPRSELSSRLVGAGRVGGGSSDVLIQLRHRPCTHSIEASRRQLSRLHEIEYRWSLTQIHRRQCKRKVRQEHHCARTSEAQLPTFVGLEPSNKRSLSPRHPLITASITVFYLPVEYQPSGKVSFCLPPSTLRDLTNRSRTPSRWQH